MSYVRDVTLCEDHSRIRKNAGAMARMRSIVLNILALNNEAGNVRQSIKQNSWNNQAIHKYEFLWEADNSDKADTVIKGKGGYG